MEQFKKTPLKKHIRNFSFMTGGSLIVVISFLIFIQPNSLLSGGVWGIAAIIRNYLPLPLGIYLFVLNIPLIIIAWRKLRKRFVIYTIFVIVLQSILLIVLEPIIPAYNNDTLLSAIFGGVLFGFGGGLIVKYHGSGGGMDIIGILLQKKYDISVGTFILVTNIIITFIAAFIFGFEPAMYTMVDIYIASRVFTQVLAGFNSKRQALIVTEKGDEVARRLIHELQRGVTKLAGEGGYTHHNKDVLICVVSRFEMGMLKEIVAIVDPQAFVSINETYEVLGTFFKHDMMKTLLEKEKQK